MNIREFAIYFSGKCHKDQRYADSLYVYHLGAVDQVLAEVGFPEICTERIAAWLHDSIEDCANTDEEKKLLFVEIEKLFGSEVSDTVHRVTNESGANRKERAAKTYPKISTPSAVAVKLADRIANIEHSLRNFSRHALMYLKEDEKFSQIYVPFKNDMFSKQHLTKLIERYEEAIKQVKVTYGIH